ncbi:hypothetical protein RhiirA1_397363 [Rhizophagus irregularis]|uniref:Alpha/beta hydrolase fold-3 domain-containing protein n=1 Tax=Rhizophagus irregularis TaxID=588596 RepID=A0A2N0RHI5_9GLOM|nr:hypothetical protein RhiirA1_397363 [Rhizophagus irregularis]
MYARVLDSGFEPLNPKNIVIAGDSAGVGIANRSLGDHRLGLRFVSSVFSVPRYFSSFGSTINKDFGAAVRFCLVNFTYSGAAALFHTLFHYLIYGCARTNSFFIALFEEEYLMEKSFAIERGYIGQEMANIFEELCAMLY